MRPVRLMAGAIAVAVAVAPLPAQQLSSPPDAAAAAEAGGSGPYKAAMLADPGLSTHTIYRPRNLAVFGQRKLPIVVWGNGACSNYGNMFRYFLTEIASHGYFVVAIGPIGPKAAEAGGRIQIPAEGQRLAESLLGKPLAGQSPPPSAAQPAAPQQPGIPATLSNSSQLNDAMDWVVAQARNRKSAYFGKLDTGKIAVMGQSCGGLQAIDASADPRVTTSVIWNSGAFPVDKPAVPGTQTIKASIQKYHGPVAYISGDSSDMAYANAEDDFSRIEHVPVLRAYEKGVGHGGTYRLANGGTFGAVAVAWLDWQLKGAPRAAAMFKGKDCGLCLDPKWVVRKKHID